MSGALSDERMSLSSTVAAGHRQRRHFRVRVPQVSRPYFTVSNSRLPFSSPPTTLRALSLMFTLNNLGPTVERLLVSKVPLPRCTDLLPRIPDY
jgi:hypothetical protein